MLSAALIAVGVACLAGAALAWSGRWHRWSRRFLIGPSLPVTLLPGVGAGAIGAGLYEASGSSPATAVCFVAMIAGSVLFFWSPAWFGPRWLREQRREGIEPDVQDPLTALSVTALAPLPAGATSVAVLDERFRDRTPIERWNATWVQHEEGGEKPHAFGRAGTVGGKLELYEDALAFRAIAVEDRLRRGPTVVLIERATFGETRVVPAGAGPDGRKRPRQGPRSAFARLVVDTDFGPFLFEVNGAERKARRIAETLGSES
jgi:hypothetical protein